MVLDVPVNAAWHLSLMVCLLCCTALCAFMCAGDVGSRLQVLEALTRKFRLGADVQLSDIAQRCADRWVGERAAVPGQP